MLYYVVMFLFFKQKTAYEMRISDWSSDVCSSDCRFRVHLPSGVADFIDLEAAASHAETHATLLALDQARRAGADEPQIQVTRDDTIITERGGGSVFIDSKITAVAVGRPRLAR